MYSTGLWGDAPDRVKSIADLQLELDGDSGDEDGIRDDISDSDEEAKENLEATMKRTE